jgi:hypothetical protein
MKITQLHIKNKETIIAGPAEINDPSEANLILVFGEKNQLLDQAVYQELSAGYPNAEIVLCSSAGEILGNSIQNETIVCTVIQFEKTTIKTASVEILDSDQSFEKGKELIEKFTAEGLTHVLVLSDGLIVNGSQLVKGMHEVNSRNVPITGGLAGDSINFEYTVVGLNGVPSKGKVVAIAFYGEAIDIRFSALGGWDAFGPERVVTKATGTKIYEIDNRSVIELFKIYLGPYIDDKANSILLFPLSVKLPGYTLPLVRSILGINEQEGYIFFTGDIPVGSTIRFMKANFEKLIDAAGDTAKDIIGSTSGYSPKLTLIISCIGRKKVLEKRIEEEVDIVSDCFGPDSYIAGFYSYGELSPNGFNSSCELHNQTMTITTFNEI